MSALDNPFHRFAMDIEGVLLQARAEIIGSYEMLNGDNAEEPDVQDAVLRLVSGAYKRLDRIRDAHVLAFKSAAAEEDRPAEPDPFVERMAVYEQDVATYNSNDDNGPEPGGAFCDEIRSGKLAIGNVEGAILALRRTKAIDCIIDTEGDVLVDAVIAFLEQGRVS